MKLKGFDDWIEIFRSGRQKDSQGREHDGDRLIDRALAGFDAAQYEPPVVVGHPEHDSPAYGWVKALRKTVRNGAVVLEARLGQLVPEFREAVRQGRYKKRSAAFFDDGRLRHVGFLGGVPPAVSGLKDIAFREQTAAAAFEFAGDIHPEPRPANGDDPHPSPFNGGNLMDVIKDFLAGLKEMGLKLAPAGTAGPGDGAPGTRTPGDSAPTYTKAELDEKLEQAVASALEKGREEGKKKAETEIENDRQKTEKERLAQLRQEKITAALDKLVAEKKLSPADAANLKAILLAAEGLDDRKAEIEFAAEPGKTPEKRPAGDWLLHRLEQTQTSPLFMAMATPDQSSAFATREEERLARKIAGVREVK